MLLAGCNSIFGLNDNAKVAEPGDGPVLVDGKLDTFQLRYLQADTKIVSPSIVNEPAEVAAIGMVDLTSVKVGTLDGELFEAPYDNMSGEVGIPLANLTEAPWRVRYTVAGVEHQVQWQPELVDAKIALPFIGRLDPPPPPADSGYDIKPTGATAPPIGGFNNARVFTTGVFLDMRVGASPSNTTIPLPTTTAFRALGSPVPGAGDAAVLVNYAAAFSGTFPDCAARVNGYAHFLVPELLAGTKVPPVNPQTQQPQQPAWITAGLVTQTFTVKNAGAVVQARLLGALGSRASGQVPMTVIEHGVTASVNVPGVVVERPVTSGASTLAVPGPHMLMLSQCNLGADDSAFIVPNEIKKFPQVTHGLLAEARIVDGATLVSSVVSVVKPIGTTSEIDLRAPLAIDPITLTAVDSTVTSLSGDTDGVALFSVAVPFGLHFALEPNQGVNLTTAFDQFEVAVFQIAGGALIKKRTFVSADVAIDAERVNVTPVQIDLAGLGSGTYVMSIRTIKGTPSAVLGNFEELDASYSASTVFTRSFVIP